MGHTLSAEKRRTQLMRLPIGDLVTWHLWLKCPGCRDDRYLPVKALADRYGPALTLSMVMPRLRCRHPSCKLSPESVRLRNRYPVQHGAELIDVVLRGPGAF